MFKTADFRHIMEHHDRAGQRTFAIPQGGGVQFEGQGLRLSDLDFVGDALVILNGAAQSLNDGADARHLPDVFANARIRIDVQHRACRLIHMRDALVFIHRDHPFNHPP